MLSDSKMPVCLGSQDLLQNANVVMMLNPEGHLHQKRGLSGMNSDGLLPMVILMVRANSMVAPDGTWMEVWYFCEAHDDWAQVPWGFVVVEDAKDAEPF